MIGDVKTNKLCSTGDICSSPKGLKLFTGLQACSVSFSYILYYPILGGGGGERLRAFMFLGSGPDFLSFDYSVTSSLSLCLLTVSPESHSAYDQTSIFILRQ